MSNPFQKTLRSLEADQVTTRTWLLSATATALLILMAWALLARIPLFKVSTIGRLEPYQALHRIEAPVGGRVVRSHLKLDRQVEEGDLLFELDAGEKRFDLARDEARHRTLSEELALLEAQIASEERESELSKEADDAALTEASARLGELGPRQRLAEQRKQRAQQSPAGAISTMELLERQTEAESLRRSMRTQGTSIARLARDHRAKQLARENRVRALQREALHMRGEVLALAASLERLRYEIGLTEIRAAAPGRLCDVVQYTAGAFVRPGDRLGSIVSDGTLRMRARFSANNVGVIHPGQPAQIKLPGYPWQLYGTVAARVSSVGTEPDTGMLSGLVRVELALEAPNDPRIQLEHGLQAIAEVEVDRVSPAALLLRAIGEWRGGAPEGPAPAAPEDFELLTKDER